MGNNAAFVSKVTGGTLDFDYPVQVNRLLSSGGHDLIISVGQVVPHEVMGMANYNKNIFVGCGGSEAINKSHFMGAVHGIENILGTVDNPVRAVLNKASEITKGRLPLLYLLTVVSPDAKGELKIRGFFAGDDVECFRLSLYSFFLCHILQMRYDVANMDAVEIIYLAT